MVALPGFAPRVVAQSYAFSTVEIVGNQRIEAGTILTYAGIARGETVTGGQLNDASQRILASGLFETVELEPRGNTLVIHVVEFPTINRISIEGNRRIDDAELTAVIQSQPRRVYSPSVAEADAAAMVQAYSIAGRVAASVEPRIIRRSDNRVDLVFEVAEGRVSEVERISFVGNRAFSDRRLRRVLESKQAGFLRAIVRRDNFIADRIEFDKQVLRDFYLSRGFIDFETLSVNSELTRGRDGFLVTFNVREGQSFDFGELTVTSDLAEVDVEQFEPAIRVRSGSTYSPTKVEQTIARLERFAIREELDFIRVEPRITRNDRDLTLDVEFVLSRGPRVFVERIDIEGNTTTLDRVVRNQFRIVEGDPFNPREIRESAERVRALGFFSNAEVSAREGSSPDQVIVDVDLEEAPTGSLTFGASYSQDSGAAFNIGFQERNFLGRGQRIRIDFNTAEDSAGGTISFTEPNLLGRDLSFGLLAAHTTTENENSFFSTRETEFRPSLTFPVSENGRLSVNLFARKDSIYDVSGDSSALLQGEAGGATYGGIGYRYSFDTRRTGLNPDAGIVLRFGQEYAAAGDANFIRSDFLLGGETKAFNDEVTLRAIFEAGALHMINGDSRVTDRYRQSSRRLRGFAGNGIGPRDLNAVNMDAVGGNYFAVARFEADFPLGLPEEYGISGGLFFDVGSIWGLDNTAGTGGPIDDSFGLRSVVGFSVFWDTPIGPLRFNFSHALTSEDYDDEQSFDLTISTTF